jgi:hypothetical protein
MAFTASYSVSQSADSTSLTIKDTSSYVSEAQSTFTSRVLYLYKTDGTTIKFPSSSTTEYINFPFTQPNNSITITGFTQDLSLIIRMVLTSSSPVAGSVYTSSGVVSMTGFTNAAVYNAVQILATNPSRADDQIFFSSLSELQTNLDAASTAAYYGDQFAAQSALDRANVIIQETNIRF